LSDVSQGPGWWQASDRKWYPPQDAAQAPAPGWWLASDGEWYPPRETADPPHPDWWLAADGKWYPPEPEPAREAAREPEPTVEAPSVPDARAARAPRRVAEVSQPAESSAPDTTTVARDASSQILRRDEASRADAVTQAQARFLAASRAVRLLESDLARTPPTRRSARKNPRRADVAEPIVELTSRPPDEPDVAPVNVAAVSETFPSTSRLADPPPPAPDGPLFEIRSSPLGADVEHLGDHLVVFGDRLELRDRTDRIRRQVRDRDITEVSVQRKFTGAVLTVESGAGEPIVVKGIKPEQADEVRRLIQTRLLHQRIDPGRETARLDMIVAPGPQTLSPSADAVSNAASRLAILNRDRLNEADLLRKLADLHRAGVLSDLEFEEKIALVGRLVSGEPLLIG
jgi:hypothetical protein